MATESSNSEQNWLERMNSFLSWKLQTPEINNPYKQTVTDKVLKELSTDLTVLKKYVKLRGFLDGEEIFIITDLTDPRMQSDHPNLSKMPKSEIKRYLDTSGLIARFDGELAEVQKQYQVELQRRASSAKR